MAYKLINIFRFLLLLIFLIPAGFFLSCKEPSPPADKVFIVSFLVSSTSDPASVAFTVTELETETPITAANNEFSGIIDFNSSRIYRVEADFTGLPPDESITLEVWYEEVEDFPPENARRLAGTATQINYEGTDLTSLIYADISVPFPAGY